MHEQEEGYGPYLLPSLKLTDWRTAIVGVSALVLWQTLYLPALGRGWVGSYKERLDETQTLFMPFLLHEARVPIGQWDSNVLHMGLRVE